MALRSNESGYTVKGLLLLMAAILVLMTMIVPALEHTTVRANETEAISSLKTLNQMEGQYAAAYGHGFACELARLGGNPKLGPPSAAAAQLVPDDIARGRKAGYTFRMEGCGPAAYVIVATPDKPGKTGWRTFCVDQSVALRVNPAGGNECTETLR